MYISTEGIVLKQVKTMNDRRMLVLFSRRLGKINAASNTMYQSKSKSSNILHPFNYGKYGLFQGKEVYNINNGEVIKSFYKIGEDLKKYACCSYILELTDKILPENQPDYYLFELLLDFLEIMETRTKHFLPIVRAFEIRSLAHYGIMPQLSQCVRCGNKESTFSFSIEEGGLICQSCKSDNTLLFNLDLNIINIIKFIASHPLKKLEKLSIDEKVMEKLNTFMKLYLEYHLDTKSMKSIEFMNTCITEYRG